MRTIKTPSVSLPEARLKDVEKAAMVREEPTGAHYQSQLEETNSQWRAKAAKLGITEADVIPLIHEWRRERRAKNMNSPTK